MTVVADTGPLLYLALIGHLAVLPSLYGRILVPRSVHRELLEPRAPEAIRAWAASLPPWASVAQSSTSVSAVVDGLDAGEAEAILLALELEADLLLLDELKARKRASGYGLAVTGTLGILLQCDRRGLLDLENALNELERTSFYLSAGLRRMVLDRRGR